MMRVYEFYFGIIVKFDDIIHTFKQITKQSSFDYNDYNNSNFFDKYIPDSEIIEIRDDNTTYSVIIGISAFTVVGTSVVGSFNLQSEKYENLYDKMVKTSSAECKKHLFCKYTNPSFHIYFEE